jgi:hypothetical protein
MTPKPLLHLEGAAVFVFSLVAFDWSHGGWLLFALLSLIPDASMVGYRIRVRAGSSVLRAAPSLEDFPSTN